MVQKKMRTRVGEAYDNLKCRKHGVMGTMKMSKRACKLWLVLKVGLQPNSS